MAEEAWDAGPEDGSADPGGPEVEAAAAGTMYGESAPLGPGYDDYGPAPEFPKVTLGIYARVMRRTNAGAGPASATGGRPK